jgi:hypothetical protein
LTIFSCFKGSEKGLKEDPFKILGVPRVRSRVIKNHADEAQTHNQDKTNRDSQPIVITNNMDAKNASSI